MAPFAATTDFTPRSYQSLLGLIEGRDDRIALFTPMEVSPPAPFSVLRRACVNQMVLVDAQACRPPIADGIELLGERDVSAILALTTATEPGPFAARTIELGRYIGVYRKGKLVALAGERMRLTGFTEISAVCVDPAHRGQGLAASLIAELVAAILARSETPFLHVFNDNGPAIALYRRLGFVLRRQLHLAVLNVDYSAL
jgi:ribosomal protein S18 acetylase RimI-like enzyme